MDIPEFKSVDTVRRLWWLHDSFWHAALVKELGHERADRINLEVVSPTALYSDAPLNLLRTSCRMRQNMIEGMSLPLSNIEIRIAKFLPLCGIPS